MSGGSLDYCYIGVQDIADRLRGEKDPLRRAMAEKIDREHPTFKLSTNT